MSAYETNPLDLLAEGWPYDGPHSPETVESAAAAVAQLVRYLNNATGPWNQKTSLPYAATVGTIVSDLSGAVHGLDQLLAQLRTAIRDQAQDPTLYDDRRDRPAEQTAAEMAEALTACLAAAGQLATNLQRAAALGSYLGNDEPPRRTEP